MNSLQWDNPDMALSQLLLGFGADIHTRNGVGKTVLSFLVGGMNSPGEDGGLAKIRFALQHGADPNAISEGGVPVLASICQSFVATSNTPQSDDQLQKKAKANWLAIARLLLETKRVPLNAQRSDPSPLEDAISAQTPELVALLLEFGADPNEKNKQGKSPLDWAREQHKTEMVALMEAAIKDRLEVH